jgi:hypothetical protein
MAPKCAHETMCSTRAMLLIFKSLAIIIHLCNSSGLKVMRKTGKLDKQVHLCGKGHDCLHYSFKIEISLEMKY